MDVFMPLEEKLKKENKFIKIINEIFKFICGIYLYHFCFNVFTDFYF